MAPQGPPVLVLAAYAEALRHPFGGEAHADVGGVGLGAPLRGGEVGVEPGVEARHGHLAHHLHPARQDGVRHPRHHRLGGHGDGLEAAGAEAVDGGPRHLHREARPEEGEPGDVQPLGRLGHGAPQRTSSSSLGSRPTRSTAARITWAERSTGWRVAKAPFFLPRATGAPHCAYDDRFPHLLPLSS